MFKVRVEAEQRITLLKLMEKHFYSTGKLHNVEFKKEKWSEITNILNRLGPARSCARWRKYWTDTLLRVRKKIIARGSGSSSKKVQFSKDDYEILRITGGEEKLIREFKPRSANSIYRRMHQKVPTYCVDDSSIDASDFEVTNQPVTEDFYEIEDDHSGSDIMIDDDPQTKTKSALNKRPKIEEVELPKNNYSGYNNNYESNYSQANFGHNYRKNYNHSRQSNDNDENDQEQFKSEPGENADLNEENDTYNFEEYEEEKSASKRKRFNQKQHHLFLGNQSTYSEEILKVHKETLIEMRKISESQQETNQLLKLLIQKLDTNSNGNENSDKVDVTSEKSNELYQNESHDIADEVVIKKEQF